MLPRYFDKLDVFSERSNVRRVRIAQRKAANKAGLRQDVSIHGRLSVGKAHKEYVTRDHNLDAFSGSLGNIKRPHHDSEEIIVMRLIIF